MIYHRFAICGARTSVDANFALLLQSKQRATVVRSNRHHTAPSFNGRTADSGSAYRGSNPWGAANHFQPFRATLPLLILLCLRLGWVLFRTRSCPINLSGAPATHQSFSSAVEPPALSCCSPSPLCVAAIANTSKLLVGPVPLASSGRCSANSFLPEQPG